MKKRTGRSGFGIAVLSLAVFLAGCGADPSESDTGGRADLTLEVVPIPTGEETANGGADNGGGVEEKAQTFAAGDSAQKDAGAEPTQKPKIPPRGGELVLASEDWGLSFGEPHSQP